MDGAGLAPNTSLPLLGGHSSLLCSSLATDLPELKLLHRFCDYTHHDNFTMYLLG